MIVSTTYGQIATYADPVSAANNTTGFTAPANADQAAIGIALTAHMAALPGSAPDPAADFATETQMTEEQPQ